MNNVEIKHRINLNNSVVKTTVVKSFMSIINSYISSQTKLCYHMTDVDLDGTITVPVDVLTNEDINTEKRKFENIIMQLKQYLESDINYNVFSLKAKSICSSIIKYSFDWNNSFYIHCEKLHKNVNVKMKKPNVEELIINEYEFKDGSSITEIVNPYITDALICADLCIPYKEMDFGYNVLHFYEHITCTPWFNNKSEYKNDVIYTNGFTSNIGHCYVFSLVQNAKTFENYLYLLVDWMIKSRDLEFWKKHKNDLKRETSRTISETKLNESLGIFARSSGSAYGNVMNNKTYISALKYWSNKPFNIFIRHPFTSFRLNNKRIQELIQKHPLSKVPKPEINTFNYYPYEIFINYTDDHIMTTTKEETSKIAKAHSDYIYYDKLPDGFYGIDVRYNMLNKREFYPELSPENKVFVFYPIFILSTLKKYYNKKTYEELASYMNIEYYYSEKLFEEKYITNME